MTNQDPYVWIDPQEVIAAACVAQCSLLAYVNVDWSKVGMHVAENMRRNADSACRKIENATGQKREDVWY